MEHDRFSTLVMVTAVFPYGSVTENAFVAPEIEALAKRFHKVYLIPMEKPDGANIEMPLPDNIEVVDDFAAMMRRSRQRLRYFAHPWIHGAIFDAIIHAHNPLSAATYAAASLSWKKEFERFMAERELDIDSTLFYTFWLDAPTTAMALIADDRKNIRTISRIHGYELREARSPMLKKFTVASLQGLYPVSRASERRLRELYSSQRSKISLHHLGSHKENLEEMSPVPNPDSSQMRFVSVARVVDIKRVHIILELVRKVARLMPSSHVIWTHIGSGPAMVELTKELSKGQPSNLTVELRGEMTNAEVHAFLRTQPINWNVLLSSAEGGVPVALCEGASYGIPAIATAVGGIPELVDTTTGIIVDEPIDTAEIARQIAQEATDTKSYLAKRDAIHRRWQMNFAAHNLRDDFARHIAKGIWQW